VNGPAKSARERLARVLALIPWVASQDGPTVEEVCARFEVDPDQLLEDLTAASMVGIHPHTPDELVEVVVEDGRVWVHYALTFNRPLRLTPDQGLALLAAGAGLLSAPGTDPGGPLARGLGKLAGALGIEPAEAMDVDLGAASAAVLDVLRAGAARHRQVEIDYYSHGRDERTVRVIDPYRITNEQGHWYVLGWCHRAGGERLFRVDRIHSARLHDTGFETVEPTQTSLFRAEPDDPRVVLELAPTARWVLEQYPWERVDELDGGRCQVTLAVSAPAWLERLLLQLGPEGRVVETSGDLPSDLGARAAARVLTRYRD
jgi:proteasome accessory factor C